MNINPLNSLVVVTDSFFQNPSLKTTSTLPSKDSLNQLQGNQTTKISQSVLSMNKDKTLNANLDYY